MPSLRKQGSFLSPAPPAMKSGKSNTVSVNFSAFQRPARVQKPQARRSRSQRGGLALVSLELVSMNRFGQGTACGRAPQGYGTGRRGSARP
jgi:hypothetical protein